ncbi:hypothetical protein GCM10022204_44560 [Microlunatus aurantiacus]|uniref:HPP family protein n=2 Tax=Microlunatus aurantiacus TaxID=446786 RepID=A0ABP7EKC0_9ACTN
MPLYRLCWMVLAYALGAVGAAVTMIIAPWGAVLCVAAASAVISCLVSVAGRGRKGPIESPSLPTAAMVGATGGLAIMGSAAFVGLVGMVTSVLLIALSPRPSSGTPLAAERPWRCWFRNDCCPRRIAAAAVTIQIRLIPRMVCVASLVR